VDDVRITSLELTIFTKMKLENEKLCGKLCFGRLEGTGIYAFPTETIYQGQLYDGMFHGAGILHFPDGSKYEGVWNSGIAIKVSVLCTAIFKLLW